MTEHDDQHFKVVDSYIRDLLLHDESTCEPPCPYELIPDELWACVNTSILHLLQAVFEYVAEREEVTYREEVDSWLITEQEVT